VTITWGVDKPGAAGPRLLLKFEEAGTVLGVGRTKIFELVGAGEIEAVRIGRARRVPYESLVAFVEGMRSTQRQSDPKPAA